MLRIFTPLICLFFAVMLAGCGPIYRTDYNYAPPKSSSGKMCVSQCLQNKSFCEQSCQMRNENCKMRAHEDALFQFEAYKREQLKNNQPIQKTVSNFDSSSYRCNESCDCTPSFNACYSACGGQVLENKVCVAFCDKA